MIACETPDAHAALDNGGGEGGTPKTLHIQRIYRPIPYESLRT
jgi:hypothetical protein